MEVHEHTNVRTLPEALYGVVTLDEYLVRSDTSTACVAELTSRRAALPRSTWSSMRWLRHAARARGGSHRR